MIVSVMQPAYLPWLGYFHRIAISDLHIVLDHVQMDRNSKTKFTNRNKVRTKQGWCWLTVPIKTKGMLKDYSIDRLEIADDPHWSKKHWETIRMHYAKAPYFAQHACFFEEIYQRPWSYLNDLMQAITDYLLEAFGIKTPILYSSKLKTQGKKDELILNLCQATDAKVYLSGPFGRTYLRESLFQEAGIKVVYHDYRHPIYPQVYTGFEPYMSAIDLLFNCGHESLRIMKEGQKPIL